MKRSLFAVIFALAAAVSGAADTFTVDPVHSEVSFQIRHLVGKVRGGFTDFTGTVVMDEKDPAASSVSFTIKTASINTNNPDRDKHLRSADFFDVEKHPEITFKSTAVSKPGKDQYQVKGKLSMHGVEKEVTLPVTFLGKVKDPWGSNRAGFETSTTLDRKAFGIEWNKALDAGGFVLGDEVLVTITLETKQPAAEKAATK